VLEGLRELAQQPGDYCLTVKPDGTWIPEPLTLTFKVGKGGLALLQLLLIDVQRCAGVLHDIKYALGWRLNLLTCRLSARGGAQGGSCDTEQLSCCCCCCCCC
jgi:hypothetical protein